jgi:hypothetical protein
MSARARWRGGRGREWGQKEGSTDMAEDSTRRLLRAFGVAVTDCEDALAELEARLRKSGETSREAVTAALVAYRAAADAVSARWAELNRLMLDHNARAVRALEAHLRVRP